MLSRRAGIALVALAAAIGVTAALLAGGDDAGSSAGPRPPAAERQQTVIAYVPYRDQRGLGAVVDQVRVMTTTASAARSSGTSAARTGRCGRSLVRPSPPTDPRR
jgi:hypothetical protein